MGAWLALLFLFDTPPETLAIYREKKTFLDEYVVLAIVNKNKTLF